MRRCLYLACALALLPSLAGADEVLLKGGGKISGRILSRTDTAVQVDVGAGLITVPMASVLSIEAKRSILDDYEERAARLGDHDAQGWLQLARWSLGQRLGTQARRAYERVLGIDPQNVEANQALGRALLEGRWVPEQEVHRARGMVPFEGAWMMPAERDAILAERDARFNDLVRLDAERRVRDAEQRAAEAEARAQQLAYDAATRASGIPLWWGGSYAAGGYAAHGYGRPSRGGKPWRSTPGSTWPPTGMYPSYPIGVWPSYPIGPAGSFPIGPSPPAGSVHPPAGNGRHGGGAPPGPPPSATQPAAPSPGPPPRIAGRGGAVPRP